MTPAKLPVTLECSSVTSPMAELMNLAGWRQLITSEPKRTAAEPGHARATQFEAGATKCSTSLGHILEAAKMTTQACSQHWLVLCFPNQP